MSAGTHRIQEELSHPLDSGAEGDCELPDASAGNQTQVLITIWKLHVLLTVESSLQPILQTHNNEVYTMIMRLVVHVWV